MAWNLHRSLFLQWCFQPFRCLQLQAWKQEVYTGAFLRSAILQGRKLEDKFNGCQILCVSFLDGRRSHVCAWIGHCKLRPSTRVQDLVMGYLKVPLNSYNSNYRKLFCIGKENSALSDEIQLASNIKRENETLCFVFLI